MSSKFFVAMCGLVITLPLWAGPAGKPPGLSQSVAATGNYGFYVDSEHGADSNPGTQVAPWKTLKNVDGHNFAAGDVIHFARGSSFKGGFLISSSGSEGRPITYTAYGTGPAPKFSNPDYAVLNGNAIRVDSSYIVIDGLYFHDCATAPTGTEGASHKVGAIFISTKGEHNIVRNCEVTRSPMCIHVYGQHNLITRNYVHDNIDFKTNGWWAVGIMICNSNNEVSHNEVINCRQNSAQYGYDGGAMELDDRDFPKDNISIHHNRTRGNEGFLEVVEGSVSMKNLLVAYNVSDDYQQFLRLSTTEMSNARVENNTVILIRAKDSVVTPAIIDMSWFTNNNVAPYPIDRNAEPPVLVYRNNIFYLGGSYKVSPHADFPHDHNIYYRPRDKAIRGWAILGANAGLGPGDEIADPKFVNMAEGDFHLQPDSPAIRAGVNLGYTKDNEDKLVPPTSPDIGAYQHQ